MATEKNTQDIPRSESMYLRILQEIEHEIKYGREDCTKDLTLDYSQESRHIFASFLRAVV